MKPLKTFYIFGEGESAGYKHFLPFLACFLIFQRQITSAMSIEAYTTVFIEFFVVGKGSTLYQFTLYNTIPSFNNPGTESFWKHCGKRRKCWWPAFSSFPTIFSILSGTNVNFVFTFIFRLQKSVLSQTQECLVKGLVRVHGSMIWNNDLSNISKVLMKLIHTGFVCLPCHSKMYPILLVVNLFSKWVSSLLLCHSKLWQNLVKRRNYRLPTFFFF